MRSLRVCLGQNNIRRTSAAAPPPRKPDVQTSLTQVGGIRRQAQLLQGCCSSSQAVMLLDLSKHSCTSIADTVCGQFVAAWPCPYGWRCIRMANGACLLDGDHHRWPDGGVRMGDTFFRGSVPSNWHRGIAPGLQPQYLSCLIASATARCT